MAMSNSEFEDRIRLDERERCAQELEKAYAECDTLNLLHGAARIRALKK